MKLQSEASTADLHGGVTENKTADDSCDRLTVCRFVFTSFAVSATDNRYFGFLSINVKL